MKAQRRGRIWLRLGLVAAAVTLLVPAEGSAMAGVIDASSPAGARVAVAHAAAAAPGVTLAGFTSQQYPAFFKITADGRMLTVGAIALQMTCTSGAQFVVEDDFARVRINPNGTLQATFSVPPTAGSNGATYSGTDTLTAKLGRRRTRLSGVWTLAANYSFTNGMSDQCNSGPVRFIATS